MKATSSLKAAVMPWDLVTSIDCKYELQIHMAQNERHHFYCNSVKSDCESMRNKTGEFEALLGHEY